MEINDETPLKDILPSKKINAMDLNETFGSKLFRWITFNISNTYILKSNKGEIIQFDSGLGICFDRDTHETVEIVSTNDTNTEVKKDE